MFLKIRVRSVLFILVTHVASTMAQVSGQSADPRSYGMTSGRLVATLAAVGALIGVVVGALSVFRTATRFASVGRFVAIVTGLIGIVVGGVIVATSAGFGTGGGRAGAIVALVLGIIATALGGLALARSRGGSQEVSL